MYIHYHNRVATAFRTKEALLKLISAQGFEHEGDKKSIRTRLVEGELGLYTETDGDSLFFYAADKNHTTVTRLPDPTD